MRTTAIFAALFSVFLATAASAQTNDAAVEAATEARNAYWSALDAQDYDRAYAMYAPATQAMISHDEFVGYEQQRMRESGANVERRVMRTTVYDNPQNAPAPGIYVAFDFVARFAIADRSCGYIILHQPGPGEAFRIMRSEQSFTDNPSAARAREQGQSADDVWAEMATRFCPGWQRAWAIQPPV